MRKLRWRVLSTIIVYGLIDPPIFCQKKCHISMIYIVYCKVFRCNIMWNWLEIAMKWWIRQTSSRGRQLQPWWWWWCSVSVSRPAQHRSHHRCVCRPVLPLDTSPIYSVNLKPCSCIDNSLQDRRLYRDVWDICLLMLGYFDLVQLTRGFKALLGCWNFYFPSNFRIKTNHKSSLTTPLWK